MVVKEFWQKNEEAERIIDTQLTETNLNDPDHVKKVVTELINTYLGYRQRVIALEGLGNRSLPSFETIFIISSTLLDKAAKKRFLKSSFIDSLKRHLVFQQSPELIGALTASFITLLSTLQDDKT